MQTSLYQNIDANGRGIFVRLCVLALTAFVSATAHARGVSPYLPLQQSPEIERKIERLLILADQPLLTRPITAAAVFDALPKACERDAALCDEVKRYLSGFMRTAGISHASLAAGAGSGGDVALPNRHGMTSQSNYELGAAMYWQPIDHVLLSGGALAYEGETTPTGTVISIGSEFLQVDLGYRDHWWSSLTDSAMLISTQAATMPSVTLSNYTPLTRWKLRYELFMAEMSESANIAFEGGTTAGNPRVAGIHLSIEPLPGWSLGVSRLMQYGGGEREESFGELLDAFFNPSDNDNTGTDQDFGNQVASFTSRFVVNDPLPIAVYFEYAGEDTSKLNNLRLGNSALSAGIDFPSLWRNFALTVEMSEWQNAWYEHHIYRDGLRHQDHVLGHWGADWRVVGDDVGARSWLARFGWQPKSGGLLEVSYRQLDNEDYSSPDYDTGQHFEARYSQPWQQFLIGGDMTVGRDVFGESYARVSAFIRF